MEILKRLKILIILIVPIIMLHGCKSNQNAMKKGKEKEVTVFIVKAKDLPLSIEYVAQTKSSHQVNIQARVSGFLDKRVYTEGEMVKEGQVLFLMDKKPFEAQVAAAEAALERQKAAANTATLNLARVKPLAEQNALSQKDLDDAKGSFESTSALVSQAQAELETAKLNLSYATIFSPIAGITGAAVQQDGTYISVSQSLLTTVSVLSPIWVNFSISENKIQQYRTEFEKGLLVRPKDDEYEVEVVLVDGSIFPHKGRITFREPYFNPQTGTFLIRASVDNPEGILRPNQYVRARIKGAIRPNAIAVPQRAVQLSSKGHFVWVMDKDSKAKIRPVQVGDWIGENWLITEGLNDGDRVIVDGILTLIPDDTVKVKNYIPESA